VQVVLACAAFGDDTGPRDADGIARRKLSLVSKHVVGDAAPAPTDAQLFLRIQHNDGIALAELARRHIPRLGTVAFAIVGADDLAQDVVQESLIAFWEQRERLDPNADVVGYLVRTVRNRALKSLRHERAEARAVQVLATAMESTRDHVNAADANLRATELKAHVYAALRRVPQSPREAFLLYWEHDLSYAEIAATLGSTVANVRQQMRRAVQRLAPLLSKGEKP
jgi:RNA polymerase sigma-70 factor (ECF subfamily)